MKESPPAPAYVARFGRIGLALSGGGYRATAFHLGAMDYLESVGLLGQVTTLSTVSGGTFTGARWVLSLLDGVPFGTFFHDLCDGLRSVSLVRLGLKRLGHPSRAPAGRTNLIGSMAEVYAQTIVPPRDGQARLFGEVLDGRTQLDTIVFNATEFRTGRAFRFQATETGLIGNGNVSIPREVAKHIRVADIVAASSCFPGGFEPMAFPDDFVWPEGAPPLPAGAFSQPVALMDGGIFDNQGTDSLLLGDKTDSLGMIIVSDVDQRPTDIYPFPKPDKPGLIAQLPLSAANLGLSALVVTCVVLSLSLLVQLFQSAATSWLAAVTQGLAALLLLVTARGIVLVRNFVRKTVKGHLPAPELYVWDHVKALRIHQVIEMAELRLGSLVKMATSVFMKRIRGLGYQRLFADEKYKHRRLSNLIYHLRAGEPFDKDLSAARVPAPSLALQQVAETAAAIPTALWFSSQKQKADDELESLVACGQATLCYNLMKFVLRNFGKPDNQPPEIQPLWTRLTADWAQFVKVPRHRVTGSAKPPPALGAPATPAATAVTRP